MAGCRMLNHNINCDLLLCRIFRLLFILLLALFAQSPIADAYQDNFCSPSVFTDLNDADSPVSINDDLKLDNALNSLRASILASTQTHDNSTLSLRALATNGPRGQIKREVPLRAQKTSQIRLPLSSDPSPPVI